MMDLEVSEGKGVEVSRPESEESPSSEEWSTEEGILL